MTHIKSINNSDPANNAEIEDALAAIYSEVLSVGPVSRYDDFFLLGGNSLIATQLTERVESRMGVRIPPRSFYENPTVAGLTLVVASLRTAAEAEGLAEGTAAGPAADGPGRRG